MDRRGAMEGGSGRRLVPGCDEAREILEGFLIDEAAREYLVSLITSAKAPNDEVSRLYDLGRSDPLGRGCGRGRDGEDGHNANNDGGEDHDTDSDTLPTQSGPTVAATQPVVPDIQDEQTAQDLLYGFRIPDEPRDFLIPMITSGETPQQELKKMYDISLGAGTDDFEMQMACAKSLRDAILERSYSDDLTTYLGLMRQCERITAEDGPDSAGTYWPVGVPAPTGSEGYGGAMRALERQGQEILDGFRRASHPTDMDDNVMDEEDEGYDNSRAFTVPANVPHPPNGDTNGEVTGLAAAVKKTKAKGRRPPATTGNIELICPLPAKDGSVCNKHFYDGKPYRSVQEHIRRAHPAHYIPKLPATKESFDLIVNAALGPAQDDTKIEVVCPLPAKDGSICGKRCFDGKAYRSMQEHIRKAHPDYYIPGLNANEESFRLMVNKQPGQGPQGPVYQVVRPADLSLSAAKKQPVVKKAKKVNAVHDVPNEPAVGVVRPADLSLPPMNHNNHHHQPAAKRVKESQARSPAKSPFFADLGANLGGYDIADPTVAGLMPSLSVFGDAFGGNGFLPQFDMTQDGPGGVAHLRNGMDSTISRSLFDLTTSSVSSSARKRKRDEPGAGGPDQSMEQGMDGIDGPATGQFDALMQATSAPDFQAHMPSTVAPEVLGEMSDILNEFREELAQQETQGWELGVTTVDGHSNSPFESMDGNMVQPDQDAVSLEQPLRQDTFGSTAGHYNPPVESTAGRALQPKPIPFKPPNTPVKSKAPQNKASSHFFGTPTSQKKIDEARTAAVSASPSPKKSSRPARGTVSALPIPPLTAEAFGLVQEEFAHDPFRLLVAVTFLIRTPGKAAIPVFRQLLERYPTPEALAAANPADLEAMMHHLGLSNQRTKTIQKYARTWLERPPCRDVRYGVKNYPLEGDGKEVRAGEVFGPEDPVDGSGVSNGNAEKKDAAAAATTENGVGGNGASSSSASSSSTSPPSASGGSSSPDNNYDSAKENDPRATTKARGHGTAWEIGHLTSGRYALDSWRIFCRDALLGRAEDWRGKGREPSFQPEWMRVLPEDKELRACLRWMWMREGWEWDPRTGEKAPLGEEMRAAVDEGRVAYDNSGQLQIVGDGGAEAMGRDGGGVDGA